jgi:hypothetical protein
MTTPHATARRVTVTLSVSLVLCLLAVVVLTFALLHGEQYDPLGEYPVQRVDSTIAGRNRPSALTSQGEVKITGTKCANDETQVRGETTWLEIEPGGIAVNLGMTTGVRQRGCTTQSFRNDIPDKVLDRVAKLAARGVNESTWQLTGTETPIDDDGRRGLPRTWQSQNFVLVYDGLGS